MRPLAAIFALLISMVAARACEPPDNDAGERPEFAGRVVKAFDFEERLVNPNPVPRYWVRVHDAVRERHPVPAFPAWNNAELVYTSADPANAMASSGEGSVRLPVAGGSVRLLLEPGVVPVFQSADYRVSARVRTRQLEHARARLTARFLDRDGKAIVDSERSCLPTLADEGWGELAVELIGDHDDAAFLQVQLDVLQPALYAWSEAASRAKEQDYAGEAWFDDVVITQLPRIEIATNAPTNIVTAPRQPEITALVRDLTGEDLSMRLTVYDAEGRRVDAIDKRFSGGLARESWSPHLERFGWYRASLEILNDRARVGSGYVDFLWLAPAMGEEGAARARENSPDRARFGLIVNDAPIRVLPLLGAAARDIGCGAVTVPLHGEPSADWLSRLTPLVDELIESGRDVTFALAGGAADAGDPWSLAQGDKGLLAYIDPLLDRYGQRVRRWQVGAAGDDDAFWRPDLARDVRGVAGVLARSVTGPIVTIPSRIDRGHAPGSLAAKTGGGALLALVPHTWSAPAVALGVGAWSSAGASSSGGGSSLVVALDPGPDDLYGHSDGAGEFVKRAVEAWAAAGSADPPRLEALQPWTYVGERRPHFMPRAELAAWRTVAQHLVDRRAVGRFAAAPGVTCFILAPAPGAPAGRGGALVAWNDSEPSATAFIRGFIGRGPVQVVDMFGNIGAAPLAEQSSGSRRGTRVAIPLDSRPVFIEGIDTELVRFLSSVRVDPAFFESTAQAHDHAIIIENPWGNGITGRVTIVEPGRTDAGGPGGEGSRPLREWKISPRTARFTIPAGGTERVPLSVTLGPGVEIGPREFVLAVELSADADYPPLEIRRSVEVGLSSLRVDLTAQRPVDGGQDLVVEAAIGNRGTQPLSLVLTAFAPEFPRMPATITGLAPGNQVVRRFVFPGAAEKLRGRYVTLSVHDPDSHARLNSSVLVE